MNPIDGVTYWLDPTAQEWRAVGRPSIPLIPDTGGPALWPSDASFPADDLFPGA